MSVRRPHCPRVHTFVGTRGVDGRPQSRLGSSRCGPKGDASRDDSRKDSDIQYDAARSTASAGTRAASTITPANNTRCDMLLKHAPSAAVCPTLVAMCTPTRPMATSSSTFGSPFSIALRNRLQDLALRQDAEVDDEAKRVILALRMRLYALALTRRIDDEEEANGRGGTWSRRKKRPTVEEDGATKQWSRLLLGDGRPIGYVLAPVGDQYRGGRGRRHLPRRPVGLLRVTILDEMTEVELEDSSE